MKYPKFVSNIKHFLKDLQQLVLVHLNWLHLPAHIASIINSSYNRHNIRYNILHWNQNYINHFLSIVIVLNIFLANGFKEKANSRTISEWLNLIICYRTPSTYQLSDNAALLDLVRSDAGTWLVRVEIDLFARCDIT